jgi:hypothetical protein
MVWWGVLFGGGESEVVMSYITILSSIIFLEGLTKTIDVLGRNTEIPV